MIQPEIKVKWWFPIAILFLTGSCYFIVAVFPVFRLDFVIIGAVITTINVLLAIWRVKAPKQTDSHRFRTIAIHGFTLAILLLSFQFWLAFLPNISFLVISVLLFAYIAAWFFPLFFPHIAQRIYRDLWFPNKILAFLFITLILTIKLMGRFVIEILPSGTGIWLVLAVITTILFLGGNIYLSTYLLRQKDGKKIIPTSRE